MKKKPAAKVKKRQPSETEKLISEAMGILSNHFQKVRNENFWTENSLLSANQVETLRKLINSLVVIAAEERGQSASKTKIVRAGPSLGGDLNSKLEQLERRFG